MKGCLKGLYQPSPHTHTGIHPHTHTKPSDLCQHCHRVLPIYSSLSPSITSVSLSLVIRSIFSLFSLSSPSCKTCLFLASSSRSPLARDNGAGGFIPWTIISRSWMEKTLLSLTVFEEALCGVKSWRLFSGLCSFPHWFTSPFYQRKDSFLLFHSSLHAHAHMILWIHKGL